MTEASSINPDRRGFLGGMAALGAAALVSSSEAAPPLKPRRILLAHGLLGFRKIGATPYFNGVQACFDAGSIFMAPSVEPAGRIADRAAQLAVEITKIPLDQVPTVGKIHIVAHSMGGLDARFLISPQPAGLGLAPYIASLTTISTPHRGSPLADIVTGKQALTAKEIGDIVLQAGSATIDSIFASLGKPAPSGLAPLLASATIAETLADMKTYFGNLFDTPPDAFSELTPDYLNNVFNPTHNSLEGVPLLCYSGISSPKQTMCRLLYAPSVVLKSRSGDNDGVVPTSSSSWGSNVRTIVADHMEEVGLGKFFDGKPSRDLFHVNKLYSAINSWQKSLPSQP